MINEILLILMFLFVCFIFFLSWLDLRIKRVRKSNPLISFIIPCYNDGDTIEDTIKSIYNSYDKLELIVANDNSTDDSREKILRLKDKYNFIFQENDKNEGKVETINRVSNFTTGDIIFIVDADTCIRRDVVDDIIARFDYDYSVKAVSCPYRPKNKGFFPKMIDIEYKLLGIIQCSNNIHSNLNLWGGCLAVRRDVFIKLGGFLKNQIIEDCNLALRIIEDGGRVQEVLKYVDSGVPNKFKDWWKQKIRWNSGAMQCFIEHPKLYITHPTYAIFLSIYLVLVIGLLVNIINFILSGFIFYKVCLSMFNLGMGLTSIFWAVVNIYKLEWIRQAFLGFGFMMFSIPYVIMTMGSWKQFYKIFYLIPYSLVYYPLFTINNFVGFYVGIKRYRSLKNGERAW